MTTAHSYNFLRIPKFVGFCKLRPVGVASGGHSFFNDLSEITKSMTGLQGVGLLKRWFLVEKVGLGWRESAHLGL